MKKLLIFFYLFILLVFPFQVSAGGPLDTIEAHVNEVLDVLRDPAFKGEIAETVKGEKLGSIANKMFEFTLLSRRSLGNGWKKLNADQQKEFVGLYKGILEKTYMDKIMTYTDVKVVFTKDTMLSETRAEVQSMIVTASHEFPVNYRMINKDGKWMIYDIIIEGFSLVRNYRSQFRSILSNKSPQELLEILREKAKTA